MMLTMWNKSKVATVAAVLSAMLLTAAPASAKSVQEFEAMAPADQSSYMISFLQKMTFDLSQKNPQLAQTIKDYFVVKQSGKPFSEGLEKVTVELVAIDNLAKQGKADLSKIQIESIVVYVVKQKFPPPDVSQK
jgi:soluble cytochrome b562